MPQGTQELQDRKVNWALKDYKDHRGQLEYLAEKERWEILAIKDLKVQMGQWELKGVMEDLGCWGKKENLDFLEIQDHRGKWASEESREIMASQATVRWDEKE